MFKMCNFPFFFVSAEKAGLHGSAAAHSAHFLTNFQEEVRLPVVRDYKFVNSTEEAKKRSDCVIWLL